MDYLGLAMQLGIRLMEHIPNYDQRKREKFHKLIRMYQDEIVRPADMTDHDLIMNLKQDIHTFLEAFSEEIKQ